ncbi:helix-turn-helix domain-containing protein [Agrobacterium larrymoorei]|uniref:Transcriptional regulator with XRE-family HTH domain n=1 Tax=Agrobacterium larrymoorei TaxID=160699 RepID=A0ABU0ULX7_9HYPH|nr:helix-turn-helix transcriptional regulator [Agrobacterium larrymoorei]MDQ1185972.1 transcriptional regulator with XRE-family HTH domain [Agrobacterium larrymoorei]
MLNTETTRRLKQASRPIDEKIGATLRDFRKARGMTQEQLGDGIKVTFQQIQKYEKGTNRLSVSALFEVCRVLKMSPLEFLSGLVDDAEPTDLSELLKENRYLKEQLASVRRLVS